MNKRVNADFSHFPAHARKRGLSNLVATVLIVLLALAAVAIVWSFLSPAFQRTGSQIDLRTKCFDLNVQAVSCTFNYTSDTASVTVRNNGDTPELNEFVGIIELADDSTHVQSGLVPPGQFATTSFSWAVSGVDAVDGTGTELRSVRLIPRVSDGQSQEECAEIPADCTEVN